MNLSLLTLSWREMARRPLQTGLMMVGIAVGVSVIVAIDVANASARKAFDLATRSVVGRTTHQVGSGEGVPEEIYALLRQSLPDLPSAPIVEGRISLGEGPGRPVRVLGLDPLADAPFRSFLSPAAWHQAAWSAWYTRPGRILMSQRLAELLRVRPGDTLAARVGDRPVQLEVLGVVVAPPPGEPELPEDIVLMDVAAAQELLGAIGRLTRIELVAKEEDLPAVRALLPPGVDVRPVAGQGAAAGQLSAAFRLNLTALSLLASLVGMFLIFNTMTFSVIRRRSELGTLRALGLTDLDLFVRILTEGLLVAVLGSVLGIGLGRFLADGAVRMVTRTLQDLYFVSAVRPVALEAATIGKALAAGLAAGALGTAVPAWGASREPVAETLRQGPLEAGAWRTSLRAAWLSLPVMGAGAGLLFVGQDSLTTSLAGMFAVLLACAFLVPASSAGLLRVLSGVPILRRSLPSRLAIARVLASMSRTGMALAALTVALSVTIGLGVMIGSFRQTVERWLGLTLSADIFISLPSEGGTRPTGDIDPGWADMLAEIPGVERVEGFRAATVDSEFGPVLLSAVDVRRQRPEDLYRFAGGSPAEVWKRVGAGALLASEAFAYHRGLSPQGGTVRLITDRGPVEFPVAAIFYDYTSEQGTLLLSADTYRRHWEDPYFSSLSLHLAQGADKDAVLADVRRLVASAGLDAFSQADVRRLALEIFDRSFAVTEALRVVAVFVAAMGILGALLALQVEQSRSAATLHALGLTVGQVTRQSLAETALLGLLAGVFAVPVGTILAWILITVINVRSFGWTMEWSVSAAIYAGAILLGVASALGAAIYPVIRLRHSTLAAALREE
jgi:putative ABC transport system permease protein